MAVLTGAIPYKNSIDMNDIINSLKKEFSNSVKIFVNYKCKIIEYHLHQHYSKNLAY